MFNKLRLKSGFFDEETEIELFPKDHRISLIYGKNGSGKSTISKSLQALKGDVNGDIIKAELYDYENNPFSEVESVHVFNEDYITSRVKLKEDGLSTIVLVGELAEIEDKIADMCEMKFYSDEFAVDSNYYRTILRRQELLSDEIPSTKAIHSTLITTFGLTYNEYSGAFSKVTILEDLFA